MSTSARFVMVLALLTPGCNSGVFGVWSATSDSSTNSVPTTVSDVTVSDSVNSPATIGFTLTGPAVSAVQLEYLPSGVGTYVPIATLGMGDVSISSTGEANQFDWDFAADLGTDYVDGLAVRVRLAGGASAMTSGTVRVGNDPPVIAPFSFSIDEVGGVVGMLFTVADTNDTVSLEVEVNVDAESGFPEGSWETALPALGQVLAPFVAMESGTTVSFFWDVVGQYGSLDSEVMVRATAVDTADPGQQPLEHQVEGGSLLRVDNNLPPVVTLNVSSFTSSDDRRRGIVVPYTLSDAEGDTPDLVFQWTLEGEPFVDLPDDEALVEEILSHPALREQFRIATPYPMPIGGLARPTGEADTVELPELGSSQSHLLKYAEQPGGDLGAALDGYGLELLRLSKIPGPLASTWLANPLNGPVAALPTAQSTTAYVLDRAPAAAWRLREIDLATGAVLKVLALGSGTPDTMTMERGGGALLVAAHDFNVRVSRIDLDTLEVLLIFDGPGPFLGDRIRGLASVGSEVALATAGGELLRLNYADPLAPTSATVLDGLEQPWGVTVDPLVTNRVYLAERDFAGVGRVLSVTLDTLAVDTLPSASPGLPHPEWLAIERGSRLLVLTDETPGDGTKELRALELTSPKVSVLTAELPESAAGLAVGPDDLRLLALESASDLAASGGVVQRRTIVNYDPTRRVATVDAAFAPALSSDHPWRVQSPARTALEAGVPRNATFVWDSRDLAGGQGRALLRLTARDADASVFEHDGGKSILSGLAKEPLSLGGPGVTDSTQSVAAADLDGDGDLDLVSANPVSSTLTVFFQGPAGGFDPVPSLTLGGPGTTDGANFVAAADLDGDGNLDLVSANGANFGVGSTLTVFFQTGPGIFDPEPSLTLGGPGTTDGANFATAADMDGDGDLDLVSANGGLGTLTVFSQTSAGVFDSLPSLTLGSPGTTDGIRTVKAADMDGDGDLDLVSSSGNNALIVFFQTGAGVFDLVLLPLEVSGAFSMNAADLDGDGDVDLVSSNIFDNTLTVFFQTGAGVFDPVPSLILGGPATTPFSLSTTAADVDGDGDVDLLSANLGNDTVAVFFQTGAGVFDPVPSLILGSTATNDGPVALAVADLDGDGNADIVSANNFSNTLTVFFQTGGGVFGPMPSRTVGTSQTIGYPASVAAADLDGDGDLDLVSANLGLEPQSSSSLSVFFQTGPGNFETLPSLILGEPAAFDPVTFETIPAMLSGAVDVVAADLDGDGDLDLASANGYVVDAANLFGVIEAKDTLTVFFQTAPGVFDPDPLSLGGPATTDGAMGLASADLDGDGDLDLVSANVCSGTLTVFFQTGAGVFDPAPSLTLGSPATNQGAASVLARDLDGDGDLDLVSANGFDVFTFPEFDEFGEPIGSGTLKEGIDTLTVFFQIEPGVFDLVPSLTLGGSQATDGAVDLTAADMDGDGDLDLVCANDRSNSLTVFSQTSPGVFDPVPSFTLDYPSPVDGPQSVTAADMDGDGDLDLVCASPGGGLPGAGDNSAVTVFFQRSVGVFESETFILSGPSTVITAVPVGVTVADLDGDGDPDIVSGNGSSSNLTVFYGTHEP